MMITSEYLQENPDHVFVFGDNTVRQGLGGAAKLRNEPNTYGFITKKFPNNSDRSFYRPSEYRRVFAEEMAKLEHEIRSNQHRTYLISRLGAGLANRYSIWQKIIRPGLERLRVHSNVKFLYGMQDDETEDE